MSEEDQRAIRVIVADVLDVAPDDLEPDEALARYEQWDSLHQLNVLLALEERFGMEMAPDDLAELTDLTRINGLVDRRRR